MDMLLAGIFTNLSTFTPWILDTMAKDSTKLDKPKATEILTKETEATKCDREDKDTQLLIYVITSKRVCVI